MNLFVNWDLQISLKVFKTLNKIPKSYAKAILVDIRSLSINPYWGDIRKMKGEEDVWRRRAGDYRIFYKIDINRKSVFVFKVERRSSKTYR